jgi:hypothetical protein
MKRRPIQLHTDLHVKAGQEQRLVDDFHNLFLARTNYRLVWHQAHVWQLAAEGRSTR